MNIREDTIVFILQQIMFTFHGMGARILLFIIRIFI